ncbi:MAG: L,D-transpeptidase family protein [Campylobacter sp.]|nr:L,D-transpeptidase family protein [Campylobacter sp.]
MKKTLFLLTLLSYLGAVDYEDIYLKNGANAVIKAIEKSILTKDYWSKRLENRDLKYGYYDNDIYINLIDKDEKELKLISIKNGKSEEIFKTKVITGKSGDKLAEGDLKTPIGVYDLVGKLVPGDPYLGPLAYVLSYPNLLDKHGKRNGSGIWIHGYPLNGDRTDEVKTKGCVAMKNDVLMEYEKLFDHKKSIAFIYENGKYEGNADEIGAIFAGIFAWKKAWSENRVEEYLKFYDEGFLRFDGMSLENFKNMKRRIFAKNENKKISFTNFIITPYPNSKKDKMYRINFYEDYWAPSYKFQGKKTLYVKLYGEDMRIVVEE